MNLFNYFLYTRNQCQDCFTHSFSSHNIRFSSREIKISFIALLTFASISLLIYAFYQRLRRKEILEQSHDDESDTLKRVDQKFQNIHHLGEMNNDKEKIEISKLDLPSLPEIDCEGIFLRLASETRGVSNLPYLFNSCRFPNISCPKDTCVSVAGSSELLYLHANHVHFDELHLIISQYPLKSQIPLFWRASEKACLIIDLTNDKDMQKGLSPYAPRLGKNWSDHEMVVDCTEKRALYGTKAHLYTYQVKGLDSSTCGFHITRLHYEGWNDFDGINEDDLDFIIRIFKQYQKNPAKPIIIHCRAGVGRSGTISVSYAIALLIEQGKVDASNLMDHICRLILEGRGQRGAGFVQTPEQLQSIWKWSWKAVHCAQQQHQK